MPPRNVALHCVVLRKQREEIVRFRQGPADPLDARMVHAPERAAAGLRVGIRRRQPAGACLGRLAGLRDRPRGAGRHGRPRFSRARLPQADAEFHLEVVSLPKDSRTTTSFGDVFSASTTSASSIAASRCRPATSNQPGGLAKHGDRPLYTSQPVGVAFFWRPTTMSTKTSQSLLAILPDPPRGDGAPQIGTTAVRPWDEVDEF